MTEINIAVIGFALILVGFLIVLIGSLSGKDAKIGFGGFIGPIPFGWANDPAMGKWVIAISAVMAIVFVIAILKGIRFF